MKAKKTVAGIKLAWAAIKRFAGIVSRQPQLTLDGRYQFEIIEGAATRGVIVEANHPAHAMSKFRKLTGAKNHGCDDRGGWKGYSVRLAG